MFRCTGPFESLVNLSFPPPKKEGSSFNPISHHELLESLWCTALEKKWQPKDFGCYLSQNRNNLAAWFDVTIPSALLPDVLLPAYTRFFIGATNSTARLLAMNLFLGLHLPQEAIYMPLHKIPLGRHTSGFALNERVEETLREVENEARKVHPFLLNLSLHLLSVDKADKLMLKAGRKELLPWSKVGVVDRQFRHGLMTAWNLLYLYSRAAKDNPRLQRMNLGIKFLNHLKKETKL